MAKIDHLDIDPQVPYNADAILSGDHKRLAEEHLKLVRYIQELLDKMTIVTNLLVDLYDGEAIYSQLKLADGSYPVGTWRLIQVGDNWERQVQEVLGTWTFAGYFGLPV